MNPAGICLLKVNNRSTRKRSEICSKLTIKTLERRASTVDFERVIAGWEITKGICKRTISSPATKSLDLSFGIERMNYQIPFNCFY